MSIFVVVVVVVVTLKPERSNTCMSTIYTPRFPIAYWPFIVAVVIVVVVVIVVALSYFFFGGSFLFDSIENCHYWYCCW